MDQKLEETNKLIFFKFLKKAEMDETYEVVVTIRLITFHPITFHLK